MKAYEKYLTKFEAYLQALLPSEGKPQKVLYDAMNYSLLSGGKRIRPLLVILFCKLCGGDVEQALPFAAAVEMVHTYSLIHDDLPCMDNDDLRRGRPTSHKMFGEANAVLAGDGLLTQAFSTILSNEALECAGLKYAVLAAKTLAEYAGPEGMVGGQTLDILFEEFDDITEDELVAIDSRKTGDLIVAACVIGCLAAGGTSDKIDIAKEYARNIGLAFQIKDDMLDAVSTDEELGKNAGSDETKGKTTFFTLYGEEGCQKLIEALTDNAKRSIELAGDAEELVRFADMLAERKN